MPERPQRFAQPRLLACLLPRAYQKATYRGVADLLAVSDDPRRAIGPGRVPDYSMFQ